MTCSTVGALMIASSTIAFSWIALPRRIEISAVITTFASASWIRMFSAAAAKPAENNAMDGTDPCTGQHRDDLLWYKGHVDADTVAFFHTDFL